MYIEPLKEEISYNHRTDGGASHLGRQLANTTNNYNSFDHDYPQSDGRVE